MRASGASATTEPPPTTGAPVQKSIHFPRGSGTIVLPDESGLDDAPKYAPVFGWMAHDRPGYYRVVWRARRHRYSATAIVARHEEHVEDVLVNVLYARALLALGGRFALRAQRIVQALLERSWDPAAALFWDLAGGAERPIRVSTWSSLAPLALPGIPAEVKRALVERQLLHPRRYRAGTGIPSVAISEPTFNPRWDRFRCWRGPSWMATAWLLVPPLRELGYAAAADHVWTRSCAPCAGPGCASTTTR